MAGTRTRRSDDEIEPQLKQNNAESIRPRQADGDLEVFDKGIIGGPISKKFERARRFGKDLNL